MDFRQSLSKQSYAEQLYILLYDPNNEKELNNIVK